MNTNYATITRYRRSHVTQIHNVTGTTTHIYVSVQNYIQILILHCIMNRGVHDTEMLA